ncbi:hypothetical protein ABEB36_006248 [Hypothenemus hampei]|uniref:Nucleotide exchange factor Fes1 domain-containing protein n=1 Tax=Hypothenemus hampei TaxID=57062 RepID=A0ABD1EPW7_HYPHA
MPEKKVEIAGAICAPPSTTGGSNQPRQPTNLQGLLKYCVEATKNEDAPLGSTVGLPLMDEERRKWLEGAIKSMTVNVIELLQKQVSILQNVDKISSDNDVSQYLEATEVILDHIDNIDIACDFHKIGGFTILYPCLNSSNSQIRATGCELLAVLCQHNPYCQKVVLDNEFIPILLNMIKEDQDVSVVIKAVYALSCIVRHNPDGFSQFINYNGPAILLTTFQRNEDKLITKVTFFLDSLCTTHPDFKSRLVFLDYVPNLIQAISKERQHSNEHVLSLLASLVEENATALGDCRNPKYNLQQILQHYIEEHKDNEECIEELQHCKRMLYLVFGVN